MERGGGTHGCKNPITARHAPATTTTADEARHDTYRRRARANTVRDKHDLIRDIERLYGGIHVLRREPNIIECDAQTGGIELLLEDGDGVESEHWPRGAACD